MQYQPDVVVRINPDAEHGTQPEPPPPPEKWPILDKRALYGLAGDCVKLACADSEADPAAVLIQFLTRFGATVGAAPRIHIGDASHYVRLFVAVIGQTAKARKGTSEKPVNRFFLATEEHLSGDSLRVHRGGIGSGEGVVYAVRDASEKEDKNGVSVDPGVEDKRLLVIDEELAGTLRAAAREGSIVSAILRQAWDSGDIGTLTKHNQTTASGAHVCVIGHITAFELDSVLQKSEIHNGLANRFLWCGARRACIRSWPQPMPDSAVNNLSERLADAIAFGRESERVIRPTAAAERLWSELYERLSENEDTGTIGAVTARAEAQLVRLAAHYALLDKSAEIDAPHLIAAAALWDYCEQTARYVFGGEASDDTESAILAALQEKNLNLSEISLLFNRNVPAKAYRKALQALETGNKIERYSGKRINGGKAPTFFRLIQANS
jgi:hypothetical protein